MASSGRIFAAMLGTLCLLLTTPGCMLVAVDAGHEGVLVQKPFFFGHGGGGTVPATTGRTPLSPTTQENHVGVRPLPYSQHFDIISAGNAPVSFVAVMIA